MSVFIGYGFKEGILFPFAVSIDKAFKCYAYIRHQFFVFIKYTVIILIIKYNACNRAFLLLNITCIIFFNSSGKNRMIAFYNIAWINACGIICCTGNYNFTVKHFRKLGIRLNNLTVKKNIAVILISCYCIIIRSLCYPYLIAVKMIFSIN